jgi:hypothetical protein
VAVYSVLYKSELPGVIVTPEPAQATVMATGVVPGPVSVIVVAGDCRVEQSIASLKCAWSIWVMGTPVAPGRGTVDITKGAGVMVVNVHT